ncbi:hypothetical protein B7435_17985 [Mycolicibacterium peregrinum]|nr:hypothetical protein AWC21_31700 [Mycolicibacterium peregrinum]OWM00849.1 hypothetical protein B7435_17985 [Mycolicibacterium peregrinum]
MINVRPDFDEASFGDRIQLQALTRYLAEVIDRADEVLSTIRSGLGSTSESIWEASSSSRHARCVAATSKSRLARPTRPKVTLSRAWTGQNDFSHCSISASGVTLEVADIPVGPAVSVLAPHPATNSSTKVAPAVALLSKRGEKTEQRSVDVLAD